MLASLTWGAAMDGDTVGRTAVVREKGGVHHTILLTDDVRQLLLRIWCQDGDNGRGPCRKQRVMGCGVRQMRNWFYAVCRADGQHGPHCHPHNARHTVAHMLFAAKNSVALVAKCWSSGETDIDCVARRPRPIWDTVRWRRQTHSTCG